MNPQFWWHVARASGIVSWALLTASVLWGVTLSSRLVGRAARPAWLLDLHRSLAGLACTFTVVHVLALVADSWIHIGLAQILVPMTSRWRPGAVAWGVVGAYLLVAIELSSLLGRRVPKRLWRRIHALSFVLWVVATIHLVTAGTDAGHPVLAIAVWASASIVLFTTLTRVLSPRPDRVPSRADT